MQEALRRASGATSRDRLGTRGERLRLSEALGLELRDFDPARATIEIRDGKNHENRLLPVTKRPQQTRLTRWGVTKILARHVQSLRGRDPGYAAGVTVTPHVIRRTRAMHLLQAGVNLIYIRDLLGHADVSTTEIYARADAEAKRKAIEGAYQSLTPEPLPDWTADQDLLEWLDRFCE